MIPKPQHRTKCFSFGLRDDDFKIKSVYICVCHADDDAKSDVSYAFRHEDAHTIRLCFVMSTSKPYAHISDCDDDSDDASHM